MCWIGAGRLLIVRRRLRPVLGRVCDALGVPRLWGEHAAGLDPLADRACTPVGEGGAAPQAHPAQAEGRSMSRLSEWALAVQHLVWFPLHWMVGLESLPQEVPLARDGHPSRPAGAAVPTSSRRRRGASGAGGRSRAGEGQAAEVVEANCAIPIARRPYHPDTFHLVEPRCPVYRLGGLRYLVPPAGQEA